MDSPVRKMQKRNDYNRHKLLRKIKRQRRAQVEQQKVAAQKELKRRLRVTPPKFGDGKEPTLLDADKVRMNEQGLFQDEAGNIVGDSVVLPELTVRPTTPQTNDDSYYQQWLMRQANRGGRNMSLGDREAYDRIMSRVANQNEVKNFTGFDGTIYNHGSGALEQVSPEFDALTLGRQFYTDGLFRNFIKKASSGVQKIQKPYIKRYSMFDDADLESFTIDDMPEPKGDIDKPVVVNGKRYPSKQTLMNKVELVKPEHLNDAHQLAQKEIRDYVLSDEFRQRLINNGFDPDKYQHALLRYLDTKVKYGELESGTYGISKYAYDPNDMEIILNNKVLDTNYDALIHELLHAQTRHLDSESSFFIKNKIDELLMDIMKHNESIQPQMSLDAMKASGLTTDQLQALSYVEEPQEFRARVGASVLDAKRRGIDFDDYVDNRNYDQIRSLKYFYNKDDIKRYAKRFLAGLPFVSAIATNRTNNHKTK